VDSKSFILHKDSLGILDILTDEQAGQLFKAIKNYQDGDDLKIDDVIKLAFFQFKSQFDRDREKYEKICNRNRNNGLKGGRPKTQKTQSVNCEPKEADSKSDSDNKKDSDNDNDKAKSIVNTDGVNPCPYQKIVDLYHEKLPSNPRVAALSPARKAQIKSRWNNGLPDMDAWDEYFGHVKGSAFLTGKVQPVNGRRVFTATIDFLIKEANVLKVFEGNYDD